MKKRNSYATKSKRVLDRDLSYRPFKSTNTNAAGPNSRADFGLSKNYKI